MIKANELRIGNCVNRPILNSFPSTEPYSFEACRVERIAPNSANLLLNNKTILPKCKLEWLEPIALTDEILEKYGFVKHKTSNQYWSHFILQTGWNISQWVAAEPMAGFEEKGKFYWSDSYIKIEYVHQLQNLFFSLTGKELEINL